MKKNFIVSVALFAIAIAFNGHAEMDMKKGDIDDGKAGFEKHCVSCHAEGGNIVNPAKSLKKADLEKNGIKSQQDIVATMRNPGPGMPKFEEKVISDQEALAIAEYILVTFK